MMMRPSELGPLELRSKGLSYREIIRELGCGVFKAHQLISSYESSRSRIRQVVDLLVGLESSAGRSETLRFQPPGLGSPSSPRLITWRLT